MQDFAHRIRLLVDEAYPEVPVIWLVLDNLNTHRRWPRYTTPYQLPRPVRMRGGAFRGDTWFKRPNYAMEIAL